MSKARGIAVAALRFFADTRHDENGRYRSWEHCYKVFHDARLKRQKGEVLDYDYLSLHLAFYLASWGMYRGSSFLLQLDYKVHEKAVETILHEEYDILQGIECEKLKDAQDILWDLCDKLSCLYKDIRSRVKSTEPKIGTSDILISKIMMGTLGCTPAYDRFFRDGIKGCKDLIGAFNERSILSLIDFYNANSKSFESARRTMHIDGLAYPQMKLLDMGFWQIGKENE